MPDKPTRCFFMRRPPASARELCEDFAPRNGAARVSKERGANRARKKPAGGSRGRGKCVKILLPETEPKGLAGSGEQTAPGKKRRASSPEIPGPRFAPENRNRGDEREPWWPPGLQPRNPRPEVRARKPKAGRRARTMAAAGPPADPSPCPAGPLCLLKDLQVCPEGLPTKPAGMPGRPNPPGPPRLSTGPASFPGGLISLPAGPIKNAGRPPGVFSLSSYLIIYSSGLRSIPSNPSRYAFSSGSTSAMPPSWVASTFSGSTGSWRDFRRRNQPVWPFRS